MKREEKGRAKWEKGMEIKGNEKQCSGGSSFSMAKLPVVSGF